MEAIIEKEKSFMVTLRELINQREVYDVLYGQDMQEAIKLAAEKYLTKTYEVISIVPVMVMVKKN